MPRVCGVGRDALQGAQQAAVAHAVGDDMHLLRAAVGGEIHQEIGDRPFAGLDARLVGRIGRDAAARRPTEKRRPRHLQVEADLRGADRRFLEGHVEPVQEEQRVRRLAAVARGLHRLPGFRRRRRPVPAA